MKIRRKSRASLKSEPGEYPSGICVKTEKGAFYINADGKRYRIPSEAVWKSWNFSVTIDASDSALSDYPIATTYLGFRSGSVVKDISDGKIYVVSNNRLRHVVSPGVLDRLGNPKPILAAQKDINRMKVGNVIS